MIYSRKALLCHNARSVHRLQLVPEVGLVHAVIDNQAVLVNGVDIIIDRCDLYILLIEAPGHHCAVALLQPYQVGALAAIGRIVEADKGIRDRLGLDVFFGLDDLAAVGINYPHKAVIGIGIELAEEAGVAVIL